MSVLFGKFVDHQSAPAQLAKPDPFNPGLAYLYALEGNTDRLVDMLTEIVATRKPFTLFGQLFLIDYLWLGYFGHDAD